MPHSQPSLTAYETFCNLNLGHIYAQIKADTSVTLFEKANFEIFNYRGIMTQNNDN